MTRIYVTSKEANSTQKYENLGWETNFTLEKRVRSDLVSPVWLVYSPDQLLGIPVLWFDFLTFWSTAFTLHVGRLPCHSL